MSNLPKFELTLSIPFSEIVQILCTLLLFDTSTFSNCTDSFMAFSTKENNFSKMILYSFLAWQLHTHTHACVCMWCLYLGNSYSFISILIKTRGIVYLLSNECKYCHNVIDHFSGCHQDQGKTVGIDFNTL